MKKKNKQILIITLILIALISAVGYFGLREEVAFSTTFTPVYCNQYEFSCCVEKATIDGLQITRTDEVPYNCGSTATRCTVTPQNIPSQFNTYVGSINCRLIESWLGNYYKCDDEKIITTTTTILPNSKAYIGAKLSRGANGKGDFLVSEYSNNLIFTGRSGGTLGTTISSSNCVLTEKAGTIFTASGSDTGLKSYTVPKDQCVLSWHTGDRTICGNLEEQCRLDTDCGTHTYGNKECYARTLQTYGCRQLGLPTGVSKDTTTNQLVGGNILGGTQPKTYSGVTARCEISSAVAVQCCGDTDCGSGMVCDTTSFTCKAPEKVLCRQNADCGVSVQCDYSTKTMKTPICNNAGTTSSSCGYSTKSVDCCFETDCPAGYTCTIDKKCEAKTEVTLPCPDSYECCISELPKYFDKACATGEYCVNHECKSNGCTTDSECGAGYKCESGQCKLQESEKLKCEAKAKESPLLGYQWIEAKTETGIIFKDVTTTGECKATFLVYYLLGAFFLLLFIFGIVYLIVNKKKGGRK